MRRHQDLEAESTLARAILEFRNRHRSGAEGHRARAWISVEAILLWGTVSIALEFADGVVLQFAADSAGLITPLPVHAMGAAWFNVPPEQLLGVDVADIQLTMVPGMIQVHFRREGAILGVAVAGEGVGLTLADGKGRFTARPAPFVGEAARATAQDDDATPADV